jgi:uncharacterized protein with GYD domain
MEEGGSKRVEAAKQALGSVGGTLEAFFVALDEEDIYIIVDLPDNVATTAIPFVGNISGTFSMNTVVLLTPEELNLAVKIDRGYPSAGALESTNGPDVLDHEIRFK